MHMCVVPMEKFDELGSHSPYSLDLAYGDYFLFPYLREWLGGRRFGSNHEVSLFGNYEKNGETSDEVQWICVEDYNGIL